MWFPYDILFVYFPSLFQWVMYSCYRASMCIYMVPIAKETSVIKLVNISDSLVYKNVIFHFIYKWLLVISFHCYFGYVLICHILYPMCSNYLPVSGICSSCISRISHVFSSQCVFPVLLCTCCDMLFHSGIPHTTLYREYHLFMSWYSLLKLVEIL